MTTYTAHGWASVPLTAEVESDERRPDTRDSREKLLEELESMSREELMDSLTMDIEVQEVVEVDNE